MYSQSPFIIQINNLFNQSPEIKHGDSMPCTGDITFLNPPHPGSIAWNALQACVISSIYITRCKYAFGATPTPPWQTLVAETVAQVHAALADSIRTCWEVLVQDKYDLKAVEKFKKIWCQPFNNYYCEVTEHANAKELNDFLSGAGQSPSLYYRIKLSSSLS